MSLIKCPECLKEISDKAKACPFCACPATYFNIEANLFGETILNKTKGTKIDEQVSSLLSEEMIVTFNVAGKTVSYNAAQIQVANLRKEFLSRNAVIKDEFITFYKNNVNSFDELIAKVPKRIKKIEENVHNYVVQILMKYGVDYITVARVKEESSIYADFSKVCQPLLLEWNKIKDIQKVQESKREWERASRGQWVGGGFGIEGAITGAVQAKVLSVITDTFRGIGDSFVDASDRAKIDKIKKSIFESSDTLPALSDDLYKCTMRMFIYVYEILLGKGILQTWNFNVRELNGRLTNYYKLYDEGHSCKNEFVNSIVDCISEYPLEAFYYALLYSYKLMPYEKICEVVNYWGLNYEFLWELEPIRSRTVNEADEMPENTDLDIDKKIDRYNEISQYDSDLDFSENISNLNEKKKLLFGDINGLSDNLISVGNYLKSPDEINLLITQKNFKPVWDDAKNGNGYAEWKIGEYYLGMLKEYINEGDYEKLTSESVDIKKYADTGYTQAKALCERIEYDFYSTRRRDVEKMCTAINNILKYAEEGSFASMVTVGWWYEAGYYGLIKSNKKAVEYYKKAAESNEPLAICRLGLCYRDGKGVQVDTTFANQLLQKSSQLGCEFASRELNKTKGSSSECFITTAVCLSLGKDDDCYELMQFRRFRDNWLRNEKDGNALIEEYYAIAPSIVETINNRENSSEIYSMIQEKYLSKCLSLIEVSKYSECKENYINMVNDLKKVYS